MKRSICILAAGLLLSACAHQTAAERAGYWRAEAGRALPPGTTLQAAEAFFAQRGLKLVCCVTVPGETKPRRYAVERDVARSVIMHYDVAILVDTTPDDRVAAVSVQQWGVGL